MIYIDLDLNSLKIFMSVYENGGIVNASKKLYLSQPAVTISIKKLENTLGGKLFIRLKKGIKPTEEGIKFYEYCKNGLTQIKEGIENFSEFSALNYGSIKIGASSSIIKYVLMPKLTQFCNNYPNIKISFTEVINERLYKYLNRGDIDVAISEEPIKNFELYESKKISAITNCFIASKNYPADYLSFEELKKAKLAVLKINTSSRDYFEKICLAQNIILNPNYEMANYETLIGFCESNLAIGFIPQEFISKDLLNNKIKILKTDFDLKPSNIYALTPKGENCGFITQKFLDFYTC